MKWTPSKVLADLQATEKAIERYAKSRNENYTKCKCCGDYYLKEKPVLLWHNYGGEARSVNFCSSECVKETIGKLGIDRTAEKKKDLKPFRLF